MKNLLAICLLIPSLVLANPLACINGAELTELTNEYKEIPYVRGISSPDGFSVVVFAKSHYWFIYYIRKKSHRYLLCYCNRYWIRTSTKRNTR
jgi:hypothetical protein